MKQAKNCHGIQEGNLPPACRSRRPAEKELLKPQVDRSVNAIYLDADHAAVATTGRSGAVNKARRKPSSWNPSPTQPRDGSDGQRLDTDIAVA